VWVSLGYKYIKHEKSKLLHAIFMYHCIYFSLHCFSPDFIRLSSFPFTYTKLPSSSFLGGGQWVGINFVHVKPVFFLSTGVEQSRFEWWWLRLAFHSQKRTLTKPRGRLIKRQALTLACTRMDKVRRSCVILYNLHDPMNLFNK